MLHSLRQKVPVRVGGLPITLMVFIFAFRCLPERVARPTFHPDGGNFPDSIDVIIYCGPEGATIRCTTDGSDPDGTSTEYTGPINVTSTATMKARGFKGGMSSSTVASATFTIFPPRTIRRVSISSSGEEGNGKNWLPSIAADGRYVAFSSEARNLADGDTNRTIDVFVHDCQTGETTRVSVNSSGKEDTGCGAISRLPSISVHGGYVAFESAASDLVDGDINGKWDVFVHDRQTGRTTLVSLSSSGDQGNCAGSFASISADGCSVAFESCADNLVAGDTNGFDDVFVSDCETEETTRVSVSRWQANEGCFCPSISADGRFVAFQSLADNLVDGDTNKNVDVFVYYRGP